MEVPTLKSSTGTLPQPLPDPVSPATATSKDSEHSRGCSIACRSCRHIRAGTPLHQSSLWYSIPHQSPHSIPIPTPQATLTCPNQPHQPSCTYQASTQLGLRAKGDHAAGTEQSPLPGETQEKLPQNFHQVFLQAGCSSDVPRAEAAKTTFIAMDF